MYEPRSLICLLFADKSEPMVFQWHLQVAIELNFIALYRHIFTWSVQLILGCSHLMASSTSGVFVLTSDIKSAQQVICAAKGIL